MQEQLDDKKTDFRELFERCNRSFHYLITKTIGLPEDVDPMVLNDSIECYWKSHYEHKIINIK